MRREGKQHGVVKSFAVASSRLQITNKCESRPVAGSFQKVPRKPNNHSKPTGFHHRIDSHDDDTTLLCKPRDKTKGTQKFKCTDVFTNQRLLAFKVAGKKEKFNYAGFSATEILDRLMGDAFDPDEDTEEYFEEDPHHSPTLPFNNLPESHVSEESLYGDNSLFAYNDFYSRYANNEIEEGQGTTGLYVGIDSFYGGVGSDSLDGEEPHQDLAQFNVDLNSIIGNVLGSHLSETCQEEEEEEAFDEDFDFLVWNIEAYSAIGEDEEWCIVKEDGTI